MAKKYASDGQENGIGFKKKQLSILFYAVHCVLLNTVGWKDVFIQFVIAAQIKPVKSPDSILVCGYLKRASVCLNESNWFIVYT